MRVQMELLGKKKTAYGGELLCQRKGRVQGRPLSTRHLMHLVLRSTKAVGSWSFKKKNHERDIKRLSEKFGDQYGVMIKSVANVGNHLHFHIKLSTRFTYDAFIRALTGSIAMAVTGTSR